MAVMEGSGSGAGVGRVGVEVGAPARGLERNRFHHEIRRGEEVVLAVVTVETAGGCATATLVESRT